jgi:hypothetical protein
MRTHLRPPAIRARCGLDNRSSPRPLRLGTRLLVEAPWLTVAVGVGAVLAAAWLITGPLRRDDPNNPPTTITWHGCPYRRLDQNAETLASATAFEHQAVSYANLKLQKTSEDGGLDIYSLPLTAYINPTEGCNGPWFFHLKVGPDRYWRYQRPGGP